MTSCDASAAASLAQDAINSPLSCSTAVSIGVDHRGRGTHLALGEKGRNISVGCCRPGESVENGLLRWADRQTDGHQTDALPLSAVDEANSRHILPRNVHPYSKK